MTDATRLDRLIAAVSPAAGLKRLQARTKFEALTGAYKGGSRNRDALTGWTTHGGDADSDLLDDLPVLRARCRDLGRNNPVAASAIHTKVTGVVGTGLKLHAAIDRDYLGLSDDQADEWEAAAEREFNTWAESTDSDIERTLKFAEQQDLAFRSVLENGDHITLLTSAARQGWPYSLALQHIEADRLSNANNTSDTDTLVAGVRKDAAGAPIAYQIQNGHPGARYRRDMTWTELPAYTASGRRATLHLYRKLRAGQTRGVPDLATVIEPLKQLDRYTDAEIDAAVKTAMWSLLVKTETGDGLAGLNYDQWRDTRRDFYKESPVTLKDGSSGVLGLFPDDDVQAFNPDRPNSAFEPFVNAAFAQIGAAIELPLEILTKRFQSSYSAARAAIIQVVLFYMGRRAWLGGAFCQPVYQALLTERIAAGAIAAPGFLADPMIRAAYCGSEWIGAAHGQIDETKAVSAATDRVAAGLSTQKRETAALTGEDWDKVRRQREKERRLVGDAQPANPPANQPPGAPDSDDPDSDDKDDAQTAPPRKEAAHA